MILSCQALAKSIKVWIRKRCHNLGLNASDFAGTFHDDCLGRKGEVPGGRSVVGNC